MIFNGRVSPCQYRQKQKCYRNFPPLGFWPERAKERKFKKFISLVRNGLFQNLFLLSVPKILKNCLKIVEEKSMAKICNREICYFPHPFSSKQHQNLFTSEILPFLFFSFRSLQPLRSNYESQSVWEPLWVWDPYLSCSHSSISHFLSQY